MIGVVTAEVPLPSPIISAFAMAQIDDYARNTQGCQFAYSYPCQIHELSSLTAEVMTELRSKHEHASAFICVHGADGQFFVLAMCKHPAKETTITTTSGAGAGAGAGAAPGIPDTKIDDITLTSLHPVHQTLSKINTTLLAGIPDHLNLATMPTKYHVAGTDSDTPETFYPLLCILACNRLLQHWSIDPHALIPSSVLDIDSRRQTLNNHIATTASRCIQTTRGQYYWVGDKALLPGTSETCCPLPNNTTTRSLLFNLSRYPIWPEDHPSLWSCLTRFASTPTPKTQSQLWEQITYSQTDTLATIATRRTQNIHDFMLRYTTSEMWMNHIGSGLAPKIALMVRFFRQVGEAIPTLSEPCQSIRDLFRCGESWHAAVIDLFDTAARAGIDLFTMLKAHIPPDQQSITKREITPLTRDDETLRTHIASLITTLEGLRRSYETKEMASAQYILTTIDGALTTHNLEHPPAMQYTQLARALQQIGVDPIQTVRTSIVREASGQFSPQPRKGAPSS